MADATVIPSQSAAPAESPVVTPTPDAGAWRRVQQRARTITPRDVARFAVVGGALVALAWLADQSWQSLIPFVVGGFIAYAVLPIVDRLDRIMPRWFASLFMVVAVLVFIALFIGTLVPVLVNQFLILIGRLPSLDQIQQSGSQLQQSLSGLPAPLRVALRDIVDEIGASFSTSINTFIQNLPQMTVLAFEGVINTIGAVLGLLVLPTWLATVLKDNRQGVRAINQLLPQRARMDFWALIRIIDRSLRSFLQQQVALGLTVGLGMAVVALLIDRTGVVDVKYPVAAAMIVGTLELIPEVGPVVIYLLLLLAGATGGIPVMALYVGSYFVVHKLASNFVAARVHTSVQEPHVAVMAVVAVVLSQLGFVYALLSVPLIVLSRDIFRYVYGRLSDPPRPAGLLPDDKTPIAPPEQQVLIKTRPPLVYRRAARRRPIQPITNR